MIAGVTKMGNHLMPFEALEELLMALLLPSTSHLVKSWS